MELDELIRELREPNGQLMESISETNTLSSSRPDADPVLMAERIGIRLEKEIPEKDLGKPVFKYRGHVLVWEKDPAHIKVYAWATVNLFPGRPLAVDINSTARLLELPPREVRESLARLVRDGDLVRTMERGRNLYRIIIQYGGGTN
jgi:hypothetical protein